MNRGMTVCVAAVVMLTSSCQAKHDETSSAGSETDGAVTAAVSPAVTAQLDSGNAAFREQRFEHARAYYRNATRLDSALAAGWFGVYMAEAKLGNQAAADSAIARARAAAPGDQL